MFRSFLNRKIAAVVSGYVGLSVALVLASKFPETVSFEIKSIVDRSKLSAGILFYRLKAKDWKPQPRQASLFYRHDREVSGQRGDEEPIPPAVGRRTCDVRKCGCTCA